jgi:trigger factor
MKIEIKKLPNSEIEIEGELEAEVFETYFYKALKKIGEGVELDGFRKGKAPENILLAKIPEIKILEEASEIALQENYPKIIMDEKLDVISQPEIFIIKLARKNPLVFRIKTAVMPEINLPDYKEIAREINISKVTLKNDKLEISDAELENTIKDILKSRAPKKHITENLDAESEDVRSSVSDNSIDAPQLPELTDEFVRELGPFLDVNDFKQKLKENLKVEKENQARGEIRLKIVTEIIKKSEMELPEILVKIEIDKILHRMESDLSSMGLVFKDYLKNINKTDEDLRKEFRKDGEEKAKLELILNKISNLENIKADDEQVEKEVERLLSAYPGADSERASIYARDTITNEKIFCFLENQK